MDVGDCLLAFDPKLGLFRQVYNKEGTFKAYFWKWKVQIGDRVSK